MGGLFFYIALAIGAVAGGGLMVGVEKFFVQPSIIAKAVQKEAERCEGRIAEIQVSLTTDALSKVDQRDDALRHMTPTPETRPEIIKLCAKEASCRK
jgi:hypothetical protein